MGSGGGWRTINQKLGAYMKRILTKAELKHVGGRLYEMRIASGLTQAKLAKAAMVPEWAVRHCERGDYKLMAGYLRIVASFGVHMRHLLDARPETWERFMVGVKEKRAEEESAKVAKVEPDLHRSAWTSPHRRRPRAKN